MEGFVAEEEDFKMDASENYVQMCKLNPTCSFWGISPAGNPEHWCAMCSSTVSSKAVGASLRPIMATGPPDGVGGTLKRSSNWLVCLFVSENSVEANVNL